MRKKSAIFIFFILLILSLIIYSNSLNGDFLLDDGELIVANEYIKHIKTIPLVFKTDVINLNSLEWSIRYYRPIQYLTYAIDYFIWGLNPFGFHLTNVVIHALIGLFIFYLIFELFRDYSLAFLSSILFCVHPIQTEAVSYISARPELLISLFTLLTLLLYLNYVKTKRSIMYLFSLFSFIGALLSKEGGFLILIPFFIIGIGLKSKIAKKSLLGHFISFVGILSIYLILRFTILEPIPLTLFPTGGFNLWQDILNFFSILIEYLGLLIFPHSLHLFRSITPVWFNPTYVLSPILFLIFLITILTVLIKLKNYVLFFGIGWFVLMLLYLIKYMYKFSSCILTIEEHWVYLASIGFFLVLAYFILKIKNKRKVFILSTIVIFIFGVLTSINSNHWKDELDFYRYNLKFINPGISIIPRMNYINVLIRRNLYKEALKETGLLISIYPHVHYGYLLRGYILEKMQKYKEAEEAYKKALKIKPLDWQVHQGLKSLAEKTGESYNMEEEIHPGFSPAEIKIISFIKMGNFIQAFQLLDHELSISPSSNLYMLAGLTFVQIKEYQKAQDAFNLALQLDSQNLLALHNLAVVYNILNQFDKAENIFKKLKQLNSKNIQKK